MSATEEMLVANSRLVNSIGGQLEPEVNAVSLEEERQITDMEDFHHN